ncbi:MAG TPA: Crp/Fnr family transcriptional regulator [Tepidiformaceae bacterium]
MVRPPAVDDVRRMPHVGSLSDSDAARFASELMVRGYEPREVIVVEGQPARGFYFIRSGKARIYRMAADGREQTFRIVLEGDTFGEVPVFDGGPSPTTVEAMERCEIILVPSESFHRLLWSHPEVAAALLSHFAKRLRAFTELIEQISLQTVPSRLARYLYQLAREEGQETPQGVLVPRSITQQDLASLLGSVREVISRSLRVMEEDGIVEVRRKDILIRDLGALRRML